MLNLNPKERKTMASGNTQATSRNRNAPPETVHPEDMLSVPEIGPAAPRMREAAPQRLMNLYLEALHLKHANPASAESEQARISLRAAVNRHTENCRGKLEAGTPLQQFFKNFQNLGEQGQFPMMLALMRVAGNYDFPDAELLARAYRDALFDPVIAAVLEKVHHQTGQVSASAQLNMLLTEAKHVYRYGDRYANWDATEGM